MEESTQNLRRVELLGYGACALAGTLWGTGFFWGRLALDEMGTEPMVLYRFLFATLAMLPVAFAHRVRLTAREGWTLAGAAAFGIPIQFLLQFHGLEHTTVSHASLMVGTMPVLLAAAATAFAGERLDRFGWVALLASTAGVGFVAIGGSHATTGRETPTLLGDLMVLASLITALVWVILSKKLMATLSPKVVSAYTILLGTAMLIVIVLGPLALAPLTHRHAAPVPLRHVSALAWTALTIGGIFCTAATTLLWNWGIHHVPASRAGVFLNIEPALGSVLGVCLLGERLGPYAWLGGAMIIGAAVAMTARGQQPEVILE